MDRAQLPVEDPTLKRSRRRAVAALWCGALLSCIITTRRVAAAEIVLEWDAPSECPDSSELEARVQRLLEGSPKANITAATDVARSTDGYRARLLIASSAGFSERIIENVRCDIVADSVALVIALSATSEADTPPSKSDGAESERPVFAVAPYASTLIGPLPAPAFGIGAALAVEGIFSLRFELRATFGFEQSSSFSGSALGANFSMLAGGARVCRLWSFGPLDLGPCAGADLYHIAAVGFGGEQSRAGAATTWGPAAGLIVKLEPWRALAIYLAADAVMPLARRRFVFSDVGRLHRASAVALSLLIAPEVRF